MTSRPLDAPPYASCYLPERTAASAHRCERPAPRSTLDPTQRSTRRRTFAATSPLQPGGEYDPAFSIEVRRSARRKRTVAAYIEGDTIVVMIPARMSRAEERSWVDTMVARLTKAERRRRPSDTELLERAGDLSDRYLDGLARPASVRWVSNQNRRWGSCTPADGTIRLSTRLQGMPGYVVDYVLLHELTHLLSPGHGDDFWAWLARYDMTERARGFLDGVASAERTPPAGSDPPADVAGDTTVDTAIGGAVDSGEWILDGFGGDG